MTTIRNAARWAALTAAVVAATSYPAFAQTPEQFYTCFTRLRIRSA